MTRTPIDRERLSAIVASATTHDASVASLYVSTEGRTSAERDQALKDLIRRGTETIERDPAHGAARGKPALAALERARAAAQRALAAGSTAGTFVAFAWDDRLETLHLPVRLPALALAGRSAHVAPLSTLLEQSEHYAVVFCDHAHGRLVDVLLGAIEELERIDDATQRNVDWAGWLGRDQLKVNHHRDAVLHAHVQHVADRLFAHHKRRGFSSVVLAGTPDAVSKLERCLHSSLAARVVAHERWPHDLGHDELRERIARLDERLQTEKEQALLASIRDRARGGDGLATEGAEATLHALVEGRVAVLALPSGASAAGRECATCGHLFPATRDVACVKCHGETRAVADVAARAADLAALTRTKVVTVGRARGELDALGGMAGLLRFRWPESVAVPRTSTEHRTAPR